MKEVGESVGVAETGGGQGFGERRDAFLESRGRGEGGVGRLGEEILDFGVGCGD